MRSLQFCFVAYAVCICLLGLNAHAAENSKAEAPDVLKTLKDYDSIYESGIAVSGTVQKKDVTDLQHGPLIDVKRRWKLTVDGDRVAYLTEVIDYEKPKCRQFRVPGRTEPATQKKEPGSQETDANEPVTFSVRTKEWGYWGHDLSGNHFENLVLRVSATDEVTELGKNNHSVVYGPRDLGPVATKRAFMWAFGRFFSKRLDKVTRVEKSADGSLVVSAFGKKEEGENGRWELEIEPSAAWIVRKARFYLAAQPERISAELTNDGTVWSGSYCIPKEAIVNYWGSVKNDSESYRLTFDQVVDKFNEPLYTSCQQTVANSKEPKLTLHDQRVSPPTITEPNQPQRKEAVPEGLNSARTWFIVANLAAIVVVVSAVLVLRRLRRRH